MPVTGIIHIRSSRPAYCGSIEMDNALIEIFGPSNTDVIEIAEAKLSEGDIAGFLQALLNPEGIRIDNIKKY